MEREAQTKAAVGYEAPAIEKRETVEGMLMPWLKVEPGGFGGS